MSNPAKLLALQAGVIASLGGPYMMQDLKDFYGGKPQRVVSILRCHVCRMTIAEAINIINDVTWQDNGRYLGKIQEARDMAIAALRAQQERENPKPLTLDELREMDGEPV